VRRAVAASLAWLLLVPPGAGAAEVRVRGLLDLVASGRGVALESNWFNFGDSNFDAYRLRGFADVTATDRLTVHTQVLATDAAPFRAIGAYVSYAPVAGQDLHLWAGKIPWIVGTWAPRSYSNRNPLVATPLLYQFHSTLRADQIVPSVDALLARAGRGQYGVNYTLTGNSQRGLSVVYDLCWDFGVAAVGSRRPFEIALGATNGTPGRMNAAQDENDGKNFLGRIGLVPFPALRMGVSGSTGAYVPQRLNPSLPSGTEAEDFRQRLVMVDLEIQHGRVELRGEAYRNFWDTPVTGVLSVEGYYVESKIAIPWGAYLAARWEEMTFGDVTSGTGERRPWDFPRTRFEGGAGTKLSRDVLLKAVYQRFTEDEWSAEGSERVSYDLVAGQLSVGF
jgi:hypothetical protein